MSVTELEEGSVAAAAVRVLAVAWDKNPLNVAAIDAAEPNGTQRSW